MLTYMSFSSTNTFLDSSLLSYLIIFPLSLYFAFLSCSFLIITNPNCPKMYRLNRFGHFTLNESWCGLYPVAECGNWLYLSVASASTYVQYHHSIPVVFNGPLTSFMFVPLNLLEKPFSSELWGTMGTYFMFISPIISSATADMNSPAIYEIRKSASWTMA